MWTHRTDDRGNVNTLPTPTRTGARARVGQGKWTSGPLSVCRAATRDGTPVTTGFNAYCQLVWNRIYSSNLEKQNVFRASPGRPLFPPRISCHSRFWVQVRLKKVYNINK